MKKVIGFGKGALVNRNPYFGRWVRIYPPGLGTSFCGKITRIENNYAFLNPHYDQDFIEKHGEIFPIISLVYTKVDLSVPLANAAIHQMEESFLENMVRLGNKKQEEEILAQKKILNKTYCPIKSQTQ